jgi:ankyrin repeat protein
MNWLTLLMILLALLVAMITIGCGYNGLIREGSMSIWEAVEQEDLDAIQAYVDRGGDLDVGATLRGKTPLLHAGISTKAEQLFSKLLELGANPNIDLPRGSCQSILPHSSMVHHAALDDDPFLVAGGAGSRSRSGPDEWWQRYPRTWETTSVCHHEESYSKTYDFSASTMPISTLANGLLLGLTAL